jgi:hypothetical protein
MLVTVSGMRMFSRLANSKARVPMAVILPGSVRLLM